MTEPRRVVVLRALGLGDLLTGVPALRGLRAHFPRHEIVLAGPARLREVAAALECLDGMVVTTAAGRGLPADIPWPGPAPDIAVDLHGSGPGSRLLLERLGPRRLLAFDRPDGLGPGWDPAEHERLRWCRMLRWYGIAADPGDFTIAAPAAPSPAPGAVVIHPGADGGARRWAAERFAAVASGLRDGGVPVVVTAGRGEQDLARRVAAGAGLDDGSVLGGDEDVPFRLLAALVAHARAVVSGDTGLAHLAVALSTPTVTLFGPVSPALWGPPASARHKVLWHPDGTSPRPGDPHGAEADVRLLRITVPEVLDALVEIGLVGARPAPGDEG